MNLLVTGGSGAFGSAFVRTALTWPMVERVVVFSRDEHKQERLFKELGPDAQDRLRFFLGDVRDEQRLVMALKGITHVVHAAALKVVPWLEYNPGEGVKTNVGGAAHLVDACIRVGCVERVVALSTDKAVAPVNLYGATKLVSEKLFLAANALSVGGVTFSVVRYGNVSGSTGSVVPLWRPLAREGKPLPITDDRMTRYWMTLAEAVELVRDSLFNGRGGEVVVPKLPSYFVKDLAEAVWEEQGFGECLTTPVGIRPGEKLHESLVGEDEAPWAYDCGTHYEIVHVSSPHGPGGRMASAVVSGVQVPDTFRYRSDTNERWLLKDELVRRLALAP